MSDTTFERRGGSSRSIDIPSLPAAMARIISVSNSDSATADDLAHAVMLDPALSTKVLKMANSAFFGRLSKAETISQAVVTLGFSSIRTIAVGASVVDNILPDSDIPGFSWHSFWKHCVATGACAELVHRHMSGSRAGGEAAFIAGLLHDVGKLVIAKSIPGEFAKVVQAQMERGVSSVQAEQEYAGTDHTAVGGMLAREWRLAETLALSMEDHHSKAESSALPATVASVRAANAIAKAVLGTYLEIDESPANEQLAEACYIPEEIVQSVVQQLPERLDQCEELIGWADSAPVSRPQTAAA